MGAAARAAARWSARPLLQLGFPVEERAVLRFNGAFEAATKAQVGGFIILASPVLTPHARQLAALATQQRLPAIYYNRVLAEAGGLMSHGPNESEFSWRRAHALLGG